MWWKGGMGNAVKRRYENVVERRYGECGERDYTCKKLKGEER
jgi:hypothetical protein